MVTARWIAVCLVLVPFTARAQQITGDWLGALDIGGIRLRLVFHLAGADDALTATLDSLDQNVTGLPVAKVTRAADSLTLDMPAIAATFLGRITADAGRIEGSFTQAGIQRPLVLERVTSPAMLERRRPQDPVKPYPHREEEVAFDSAAAGVRLAGSLTIPRGAGRFPAVVLITGSGPQDRDSSLMQHRPFLVLADHLTRNGIVVLRLDDRGVGRSTGTLEGADSRDFARDVEAAIGYLKVRPEVVTSKMGLVGHSEGGLIASMVAARNRDVAFVVMMAGPGVRGDELLVAQASAIAEAAGADARASQEIARRQREVLGLVRREPDDASLLLRLKALAGGAAPEAQLAAQVKQLRSPWFRFFLDYDPAEALRQVRVPLLAIGGDKDRQVLSSQNLPAIQRALEAAGNRHFEVVELSGLNHLLQTSRTGAPTEYGEIEETIAPAALEKVSRWILDQ
jgi:uncharacterized protein